MRSDRRKRWNKRWKKLMEGLIIKEIKLDKEEWKKKDVC